MATMQTRVDNFAPAFEWLNPLGSWEAAARWNAMAFEWMTRGWQQWLELATVWPALENPAAALNEIAHSVEAIDVPAAFIPDEPAARKARKARSLESLDFRLHGNEAEERPQAKTRKRAERPMARNGAKRPAGKRQARARG